MESRIYLQANKHGVYCICETKGRAIMRRAKEMHIEITKQGWHLHKESGNRRHYRHPTIRGLISIPWYYGGTNRLAWETVAMIRSQTQR